MTTKRKVILQSTEFCSAPSILKWAMGGYWHIPDRPTLQNIFMGWDGLSREECHKILSGEVPHTIEGETVVVEFPDDTSDLILDTVE